MKAYKNGKYVEIEDIPSETLVIPYEERVVSRIREIYSIDDELAILRQRDTKPDEFLEYNRVIEAIKAEEKNNNIK